MMFTSTQRHHERRTQSRAADADAGGRHAPPASTPKPNEARRRRPRTPRCARANAARRASTKPPAAASVGRAGPHQPARLPPPGKPVLPTPVTRAQAPFCRGRNHTRTRQEQAHVPAGQRKARRVCTPRVRTAAAVHRRRMKNPKADRPKPMREKVAPPPPPVLQVSGPRRASSPRSINVCWSSTGTSRTLRTLCSSCAEPILLSHRNLTTRAERTLRTRASCGCMPRQTKSKENSKNKLSMRRAQGAA